MINTDDISLSDFLIFDLTVTYCNKDFVDVYKICWFQIPILSRFGDITNDLPVLIFSPVEVVPFLHLSVMYGEPSVNDSIKKAVTRTKRILCPTSQALVKLSRYTVGAESGPR